MRKALIAGTLVLAGLASAAYAQRDPAYAAARASGEVGEQADGYLGIVGAATADLRALVGNINIQRKPPIPRRPRRAARRSSSWRSPAAAT